MVLKINVIVENTYKVGSTVKVKPGVKEESLEAEILDIHSKLYY